MIYTLTTNPAIDMNICTNSIERKIVNRTHDAVYSANGKGLNVSFVLKHFGVDSKVLGFFGGFSGKYIIDETRKKDIEIFPVEVEDTTRINIFLMMVKENLNLLTQVLLLRKRNKKKC